MSQNTPKQKTTYIPNGKGRPIRYENLRPRSYFMVFAEPSRGIKKANDARIYWRAAGGFFSVIPATGQAAILMPNDLVIPMRQVTFTPVK